MSSRPTHLLHQDILYFGVDQEIIWQILQQDLPALKTELAAQPP